MDRDTFPDDVYIILSRLNSAGYLAYVVGGAVRDILLGKEPKDFDIATNAMPDEIIEVFASADFMVSDVNAKSYHIVVVDGIEIATFRHDVYLNGEMAGTVPVATIEADLARRDLTINAMAMSKEGGLIDPWKGRRDLEAGEIKFVGDAFERIIEDPARIIRSARFLSLLDGYYNGADYAVLRENISLVDKVAPERIRAEILKSMVYEKPSTFFEALHHIGALGKILPCLDAVWAFDGGPYHGEDVFTHSMWVGDKLPKENPMLRLTGYLHDVGKSIPNYVDGVIHFYHHHDIGAGMIEVALAHLKFTNAEIKYATALVKTHMRGGIKMSPKTTRKLMSHFIEVGVDWEDWLALRVADQASNAEKDAWTSGRVNKIRAKFEHELNPQPVDPSERLGIKTALEHKHLAISGLKIQELLHIGPSPFIGIALNYLLDQCIINPDLNTPEWLEWLLTGKKPQVSEKKADNDIKEK